MTDPMNVSRPQKRFAQRAFGMVSCACGGAPLAAFAVVWLLSRSNEEVGYLALPVMIAGIYATPVGIFLGIIGLTIAAVRRCGFLWPVVDCVVSLVFPSVLSSPA
ncbi:MAG: hypothetical protein K0S37_226 [Microbacterium sp.]|jgi:hypothetical protein|nr:hypothetical protein [Microbacterium sp.]